MTATWWYTFGGIVLFEAMLILICVSALLDAGRAIAAATVGGAGLINHRAAHIVPLLRLATME